MPQISGFEVAQKIRHLGTMNRSTPIIALTGAVTPEAAKRCLEAGMNDYLAKPVRTEDIDARLRKFLEGKA